MFATSSARPSSDSISKNFSSETLSFSSCSRSSLVVYLEILLFASARSVDRSSCGIGGEFSSSVCWRSQEADASGDSERGRFPPMVAGGYRQYRIGGDFERLFRADRATRVVVELEVFRKMLEKKRNLLSDS